MEFFAAIILLCYGLFAIYRDNKELIILSSLIEVDAKVVDARNDSDTNRTYFFYRYTIDKIEYGSSSIIKFNERPSNSVIEEYIAENNVQKGDTIRAYVNPNDNRDAIIITPSLSISFSTIFVTIIALVFIILRVIGVAL